MECRASAWRSRGEAPSVADVDDQPVVELVCVDDVRAERRDADVVRAGREVVRERIERREPGAVEQGAKASPDIAAGGGDQRTRRSEQRDVRIDPEALARLARVALDD